MDKHRKIASIFVAVFLLFIFTFGIWTFVKAPDALSKSERRPLAQKPTFSLQSVTDGSYFSDYGKYLLDQFPLREGFRTIKSLALYYLFNQSDNHGIFIEDGSAVQISYPLTDKSIEVYIKRLKAISEKCFAEKDVRVYQTIIPDKAYYLADKAGCPSIDYAALCEKICGAAGKYIDIFETLSADSYYRTDSHWSQEKIIGTADKLLDTMGAKKNEGTYVKCELAPFYGVYYGQSALPLAPDTVRTVGSSVIDSAAFLRADKKTGELKIGELYKTENITADDAYDVFLEGASTVAVIDNTLVSSGKTLYIFSDSFGRSLAPLLLSDYDKVVLFDVRYIKLSAALEKIPLAEGSDVLIAYGISSIDVSSTLQVG